MKKQLKNIMITVFFLALATAVAFALFYMVSNDNSANIAIVYVLALILISRYTTGFWYGLGSAIVCVACVNFLFTYPYFKLNFTLTGYPVTFLAMLAITLVTSATTSAMTKQAEQLKQREKELAEAEKERMRANLLRAVSHDIRTPLTSIIVASDSYTEHPDQYSRDEVETLFSQISEDAQWLLHMVENLLSVTRIDAGGGDSATKKSGVVKSMEPVEEIVEEAVSRVKKRIVGAGIAVKLPEEFVMIPVDPLLIEQVLINLLENAIVHGKGEKPIELTVVYEENMVAFHVRDYGIGIEESRIQGIMNGTYAAGEYSTEQRKGMGVGLSICKTIVDAHGGTFEALGHREGSEFIVAIPRREQEA
ncbi:MAG: DUF4118 domain-containing protein [Lachnospiraceae bacterium]|nr:DUF4118 domain-containing protein [Lachnospiraceae bacterium]